MTTRQNAGTAGRGAQPALCSQWCGTGPAGRRQAPRRGRRGFRSTARLRTPPTTDDIYSVTDSGHAIRPHRLIGQPIGRSTRTEFDLILEALCTVVNELEQAANRPPLTLWKWQMYAGCNAPTRKWPRFSE